MKPYDHKKIEKKWQKVWDEKKIYQTLDAKKAKAKGLKPYYVLDMFPYPSGAGLHVGHPRGYIASDVLARMKRMQGFNVLHPMGFDSFGLPAEQYAIQTGKNPAVFTEQLVKHYQKQLSILGFSFDWSRQVSTHRPEFYKWTQWIFLQIYNSYYDFEKNKARPISELIKKFEKSDKTWKSKSELEKQAILMNYRLAYEGEASVNWCPELGTVLANDEIVDGPKGPVSERGGFPVEKKLMRQWFMRITAYGDRLIDGLADVDWPENIKEIQKNWIGKSEGSEIDFKILGSEKTITVFTTRADTLFGVTYVVLAPESPLVAELKPQVKNWKQVESYISEASKKDEMARTANEKDKTGVKLDGVFAVNPANGESVPVWVADYVLASYGTGAVMAVPAHDDRDFAFAQKYNLPVVESVRPSVVDPVNTPRPDKASKVRRNVHAIVFDPKTQKYLIIRNEKFGWDTIVIGGVEEGEDLAEAAIRELAEETGYVDVSFKRILGNPVQAAYFAKHKDENRIAVASALYFELNSDKMVEIPTDGENEGNEIVWISKSDFVPGKMVNSELPFWIERLNHAGDMAHTGYGILVNSGSFDGMESAEAKRKITEFVGGRLVTKYKFRDAIFARQRYWGEPIPLIHNDDGTVSEVKEKNLPLELPRVKSYQPSGTGESPLSTVKSWVKDGYETNTMPGWAGSSWYFLRYMDPNNKKAFAGDSEIAYWKNVDMYVGGQEHATGHLMYSRFWHKIMKDLGFVKTEEPFKALRNQGMIGGADGRKMSKRWGNVINPDEVVNDLGADTLRVYESFMGPFESHLPWSIDGIVGARRFIERVWRLAEKTQPLSRIVERVVPAGNRERSYEKILHKTIKKVTDDIANFSFNTAVSAMMICVNEFEKASSISEADFKKFLQILAPFAPHMADELWNAFGEKGSIHLSGWPKFDAKKIVDDTVTLGVQVNGKVRAEVTIGVDAAEEEVRALVLAIPEVEKWIEGKPIRKFIFIPKRIISIVV